MSDQLISLKCPYCGSNMQQDEKRNLLVCPACGSEHFLRDNVGSLVPSARENIHACPHCKRNDQVMKVSAIMISQVHKTEGITQVSEVRSDRKGRIYTTTRTVPTNSTQTSTLAQKLRMPDPPSNPYAKERNSIWRFFIYAAAVYSTLQFVATIIQLIIDPNYGGKSELWSSFFTVIILIAWSFFLFDQHKKKRKLLQDYDDQLNSILLPRWERAKNRWNNAYYCSRDDLIFVSGEEASVSMNEFSNWIIDSTP